MELKGSVRSRAANAASDEAREQARLEGRLLPVNRVLVPVLVAVTPQLKAVPEEPRDDTAERGDPTKVPTNLVGHGPANTRVKNGLARGWGHVPDGLELETGARHHIDPVVLSAVLVSNRSNGDEPAVLAELRIRASKAMVSP